MYALALLVAVLTASPLDSRAPRWEPANDNPAFEVFGTKGPDGVFYYTQRRSRSNYGVNLPERPRASAPEIQGNDPETAKLLRTWTAPMPKAGAAGKHLSPCGHRDCPDNECRLRPKPRPPTPVDIDLTPHFEFQPIHALFALIGLVLFLGFWVVVVILCVIAWRLLRRAVSTPSNPQ